MDCDEEEDLIKTELSKKLDALVKREIYSKYKKAKTEEERETARREYLDRIGIEVKVANEFVPSRAKMYSSIYPHTNMICGDINDPLVFSRIMRSSLDEGVDIVIATPPCQGMSTAGEQDEDDERNKLILRFCQCFQRNRQRCCRPHGNIKIIAGKICSVLFIYILCQFLT